MLRVLRPSLLTDMLELLQHSPGTPLSANPTTLESLAWRPYESHSTLAIAITITKTFTVAVKITITVSHYCMIVNMLLSTILV